MSDVLLGGGGTGHFGTVCYTPSVAYFKRFVKEIKNRLERGNFKRGTGGKVH